MLGQSADEAFATGLITKPAGEANTCDQRAHLNGYPKGGAETDGLLFFSDHGLVAIYAFPGIKTVEGAALGITREELLAVYPDWQPVNDAGTGGDGRGLVPVPGNPDAHYRIVVVGGKVTELSLDSSRYSCYE